MTIYNTAAVGLGLRTDALPCVVLCSFACLLACTKQRVLCWKPLVFMSNLCSTSYNWPANGQSILLTNKYLITLEWGYISSSGSILQLWKTVVASVDVDMLYLQKSTVLYNDKNILIISQIMRKACNREYLTRTVFYILYPVPSVRK